MDGPILIGGYAATGSAAGAVLQLFNVAIDTLIYMPFVKLHDRFGTTESKCAMDEVVSILKESEESRQPVQLFELTGTQHMVVAALADEIDLMIEENTANLYYQPQFDSVNQPIGAEALMRFRSSAYGTVYPPLVFKVAEESKSLGALEQAVFRSIVRDLPELRHMFGKSCKISANVTGNTIQTDEFETFLAELLHGNPDCSANLDIEITEQATFNITPAFIARLTHIKDMGFNLVIDDFSMGNTSIKYLQSDLFSMVKLDGGISKDVIDNDRSQKIVSMVSELTKSLGIKVLAEYVETDEQRILLENLGFTLYQGYLFSIAAPLQELEDRLKTVAARAEHE